MKTGLSRQRGMSVPGIIFIIIVVASLGTFAVKTAPAYLDFNTIDGAIKSVLKNESELALESTGEIRNSIGKRLSINNIDVIHKDQIRIEKSGGRVYLAVDYEVRKDLFANIDLIMDFEKEYEKSLR